MAAERVVQKKSPREVFLALIQAIEQKEIDMVDLLVQYADLTDRWGEDLETPLHYAVKYKDVDVVRRLLQSKNPSNFLDLQDAEGWTALHMAASEGCQEILMELLSSRANVDATDHLRMTPLHVVTFEDEMLDAAKLLLSHDAEVNTKDVEGLPQSKRER